MIQELTLPEVEELLLGWAHAIEQEWCCSDKDRQELDDELQSILRFIWKLAGDPRSADPPSSPPHTPE